MIIKSVYNYALYSYFSHVLMPADYGKLISSARKAKAMSQKEFAAHVCKSQPLISKYESGKVKPPLDVYMHCMNILTPPSQLVTVSELKDLLSQLDGEQHAATRRTIRDLTLQLVIPANKSSAEIQVPE